MAPARMPTPRAAGFTAAGFTLVELLVTLLLLGLMAGILSGSLGFLGVATAGTRDRVARTDEIVDAQRLLRNRLELLVPAPLLTASEPLVELTGTPQSLGFIAPAPGRLEPDANHHYLLERTATGDLVLRSASTLSARFDGTAGTMAPTILVRGTAGVRLAYFGRDPNAPVRRWLGLWRDRPQPPELIRVSVDFPQGDPRRWPDLVVRPRTTVNSICRIDVLTGRCEANG